MRVFTISVFTVLISISAANGGDYIVIESAAGVGTKVTPFSSKWRGNVGSDGLYFKEFASRISYSPVSLFTAKCTFGWLAYYHKDNIWPVMPPPGPDYWIQRERIIKAIYIIPSVRTTLPMMSIDTGLLLYDDNDDGYWFYQSSGTLNEKFGIAPSLGVELGNERTFFYGRLFDSFPVMSGGGVWEFGIGYRTDSFYEHVVYLASSAYQTVGLGYRGEIKLYRQTGLSFGVSAGGRDHDNAYNMTLGLINIINH